jgi:radical SAM superfamily enzyme YgiQ (UPF0313 family)
MSNLGFRLLYELINNRDDSLCERFFFTSFGEAPRSLESGRGLKDFDAVGFSIQHEMDYTRMLDMISRSGIPLRSSDRERPLILAGGPSVTSNPMPLAPFVNHFVIGEAEPVLDSLLDALKGGRDASSIPGIYNYGGEAERVYVDNLDSAYHAVRQVSSCSGDGFSSSFLLEISRGCSRGCRFCMECYIYRPKRDRSLGRIKSIVDEGLSLTKTRRVTCISSAFFDHPQLVEILGFLKDRGLEFSLPSLRVSDLKEGVVELLSAGGQRSITLAPETPSERLRSIINKRLDMGQLERLLRSAHDAGISSVKLYFMIGLPGESLSDIQELGSMLSSVISCGFRPSSIHVGVNLMIPKSNTPFQWAPIISQEEFSERFTLIRKICSGLGLRRVEGMDYRWGVIQAYLSTGGVEASKVLQLLTEDLAGGGSGDLGSWRRTLKAAGLSLKSLYVPRGLDSDLPWEPLKATISKAILKKEYQGALLHVKK